MSTLDGAIKAAMAAMMRSWNYDVYEVTSWEEATRSGGVTREYTYAGVDIHWINGKGNKRTYQYEAGFADLIRDLDRHGGAPAVAPRDT